MDSDVRSEVACLNNVLYVLFYAVVWSCITVEPIHDNVDFSSVFRFISTYAMDTQINAFNR